MTAAGIPSCPVILALDTCFHVWLKKNTQSQAPSIKVSPLRPDPKRALALLSEINLIPGCTCRRFIPLASNFSVVNTIPAFKGLGYFYRIGD